MNDILDMTDISIYDSADVFVKDRKEYYKQWMFDRPLLIKRETVEDAGRLQMLMQKAIEHFVTNYEDYADIMPLNSKAKEIINSFSKKKYRIGTYRTDFVYDENKKMRLIEITCRFALNGLFLSSIMEAVADDHKQKHLPTAQTMNLYKDLFDYMKSEFGPSKKIFVLKGDDTKNASKIYTELLTRAGYTITDIAYDKLHKEVSGINNEDTIVSELALEELESLSKETIDLLAQKNIINDLRTVFLIHDKRFFAVLCNEKFLSDVFSQEEIDFFSQFSIPTFVYDDSTMETWEKARKNKNDWIIKHSTLGKSQKIYAGVVMDESEWEHIFRMDDIDKMILQKWIPQGRVNGQIGEEQFEDFVTGTLLYYNDRFFGFGDFRTSSHPVINVVDHRKYCSLLLENQPLNAFENYNIF